MASLVESQPDALNVREVWFSNMHLLGLRPLLCEEKYHVSLERDMFEHINKKGSEALLHFLFCRLDPQLSSEVFRDCWPVYDKKLEQQFRKSCSNWLTKIAKEEPHSKLPRMAASLLLSPGGKKFYLFLLRFSSYVLKLICRTESKLVGKNLFLSNFVTSSQGISDVPPGHMQAAHFALQAHVVRHSKNIQRRAHLACELHKEWETYASKLAGEYRGLAKEAKILTKKLFSLEEEQKHQVLTSTPQKHLTSGNDAKDERVVSLTMEMADKQRAARIDMVREMWKTLDKFYESISYQREVVDSVVQERVNMYAVKAKDIAFQIPEMVLREFESLSREGGGAATNTYHAGKLNLICLVELWQCSLRILQSQIQKEGLPDFKEEVGFTNAAIQAHRAHLAAATNLRSSLSALKVSLEENIQRLETELRDCRTTPLTVRESAVPQLFVPEITIPHLGLELLPPSPVKTHPPKTPDGKVQKMSELNLLMHDVVSTPDAVQGISTSIQHASQLRHKSGLPSVSRLPRTRAVSRHQRTGQSSSASHLTDTSLQSRLLLSNLAPEEVPGVSPSHSAPRAFSSTGPRTGGVEGSPENGTGLGSDVISPVTADSEPFTNTIPKLGSSVSTSNERLRYDISGADVTETRVVPPPSPPQRPPVSSLNATPHQPQVSFSTTTPSSTTTTRGTPNPQMNLPTPHMNLSTHQPPTPQRTPSVPQFKGPSYERTLFQKSESDVMVSHELTPQLKSMPHAHEILANQIAAAVASLSDSADSCQSGERESPDQLHSVVNTVAAMGQSAFVPRNLIPRTPVKNSFEDESHSEVLGHSVTEDMSGYVAEEDSEVSGHHEAAKSSSEEEGEGEEEEGEGDEEVEEGEGEEEEGDGEEEEEGKGCLQDENLSPHQTQQLKTKSTPTSDHGVAGTRPLQQRNHTPNISAYTPTSPGPLDQEPLFTTATPQLYRPQPRSQDFPSHQNNLQRTILPSPLPRDSKFSTPSQTMGFLNDIQPPTPFQHAEFDLDMLDDTPASNVSSAVRTSGLEFSLSRSLGRVNSSVASGSDGAPPGSHGAQSGLLIDFSTPGRDVQAPPLMSSTVQQCNDQQPAPSGSAHSQWLTAAANVRSSELEMFIDAASPELVSISGSESSELLNFSINGSKDA